MLRILTQCLWRNRRRLMICAALVFLSGVIAFWRIHAVGLPVPLPLVGGLTYFILFWPAMVGLVILLPWLRCQCEIFAVALFILSVAGHFYQPFWFAEQDPQLIYGFIILSVLLSQLYTTKMLDGLLIRKNHRDQLRARTGLSARDIWAGMVGTLPFDPPRAYPDIMTFSRLTPDTQDRRIVSRILGIATVEEHQFVEILEPYSRFRFTWRAIHALPGSMGSSGSMDLEITDKGRRRVIFRHSTVNAHPWRAVVQNWIDDSSGRIFDGYLSALENRDPDPPKAVTSPWQAA